MLVNQWQMVAWTLSQQLLVKFVDKPLDREIIDIFNSTLPSKTVTWDMAFGNFEPNILKRLKNISAY